MKRVKLISQYDELILFKFAMRRSLNSGDKESSDGKSLDALILLLVDSQRRATVVFWELWTVFMESIPVSVFVIQGVSGTLGLSPCLSKEILPLYYCLFAYIKTV